MASPYVIQFTEVEQAKLLALLREYTSPYRDVVRAKVVLLESQGRGNSSITIHFDLLRQVVSKWRRRFTMSASPPSTNYREAGVRSAFLPRIVVAIKHATAQAGGAGP